MSFGLVSLPGEVLAQILDQDGVGAGVLHLWMSGSSDLRRKIESSVTVVDLQNTKRFVRTVFPKFTSKLRSLRILRIDRGGKELRNLLESVQTLQEVNPMLEELEMNFKGSEELCLPSYIQNSFDLFSTDGFAVKPYTEPRSKYVNLSTTFPRLQRLAFSDAGDWSSGSAQYLPQTLTSLEIALPDDESMATSFLSKLPSSLLSLTIHSPSLAVDAPLLAALPRKLTYLDAGSMPSYHAGLEGLVGAPTSLVQLHLGEHIIAPLTTEGLSTLPPHLDHLDLDVGDPDIDIPSIPPSVKHLALWPPPPEVVFDIIPRHLVSLTLHIDQEIYSPATFDDFSCLKNMVLTFAGDSISFSFPASLTDLEIHLGIGYADNALFEKLPADLQRLSVTCHYMDRNIALPLNLTSLTLNARSVFDSPLKGEERTEFFTSRIRGGGRGGRRGRGGGRGLGLPRAASLRLRGLPFSFLPTSLEHLQIGHFEMNWASLLSMLPSGLKSLEFEIREPCTSTPLSSLEIFSRLPKTLEHLSIESASFAAQPEDFAFLPRTLTKLYLGHMSSPLNPDALLHLATFPTLYHLEIALESLSEVHLASLPKSIRVARFLCNDSSWTTDDALCRSVAPSIPLEAEALYFQHTPLGKYINAHRQIITQALHDPDPTEFMRLTQYMRE